MAEPSRAKSQTDNEDPMREHARRESDDPKCGKSNRDRPAPRRAIPFIENLPPLRAKLLSDSDDPRFAQSYTDSVLESVAKLFTDRHPVGTPSYVSQLPFSLPPSVSLEKRRLPPMS
jgi:hypothetical protein